MNLVGKIFVVVIFVMSLVFMTLSMMVYAMHKNWREEVMNPQTGMVKKLADQRDLNRKLTDEKDKLQKQYDAEQAAQRQAIAKLDNELELERKDRKALETRLAALESSNRNSVAAMNATQKNATTLRQEVDKLRTGVLEAQQDRDAHFKEIVKLTDQLNQAANEKDQLRKRMEDLSKDEAKYREALRHFGINENADFKAKNPPKVDGVVTAALERGLVEISIGSDMGLRKGHVLEVYRVFGGQSTYVGRAEVVETSPDKSVCKMDPKFQNSNVMVGDRVASKID